MAENAQGTERRSAGVAALVLTTVIWSVPPLILKQTALEPLDFAAYRLWAGVAIYAVIFAVVMGVVGGFFPARRASKLPVIQALR